MGTPRSLVAVHHSDPLTYETFFGLTEKPFSLNADPRFLYHSPSHAVTFENLLAGIRRREGLLVLTGEIGTGKTMLCRAVLKNLGRQTFSSFVPDPFASREDLLKMLLIDFGVMSIEDFTTGPLRQASRTELSYLLAGFLESLPQGEAFAVVIIDEAQNMSLPLIEETRILADSFGSKGHLQIVFVGQPELHAKLQLPEMRQVDQRVCGYNRLAPLTRDAVAGYIQHRLHVAGLSRERVLFGPDVIDILHRRSGGVPRLINRICDRALYLAHQRQATSVEREVLEAALIEVGPTTLTPTWASIVSPETQLTERPSAPIAPAVPAVQAVPAAPAAAAEVAATPAAHADAPATEEDFCVLVDQWVTQELAPASSQLRRKGLVPPPAARPVLQPPAARRTAATREVGSPAAWKNVQGGLHCETYLERLRRVWTKRVAIAVVSLATVYAAGLGTFMLANAASSPELPALPSPTVRAVVNLMPPAPESIVAAVPMAAVPVAAVPVAAVPVASEPAAAGDYLIAVGLFADRARADRLVEDLTQKGLPAGQRPFQLRNRRVQQVVLGPFGKRSDADDNMRWLRQLGGHDDANVVATSY